MGCFFEGFAHHSLVSTPRTRMPVLGSSRSPQLRGSCEFVRPTGVFDMLGVDFESPGWKVTLRPS